MGQSQPIRLLVASHNVRSTPKADIRFQRIICRDGPQPEVKGAVNWGGLSTVLIDRGCPKDSLPVIELSADTASLHQPSDRWGTRRIWIACACSAVFAFSPRMINFLPLGASGLIWPNGSGGSLQGAIRPFFEILLLIVLPLAFFVMGSLIS